MMRLDSRSPAFDFAALLFFGVEDVDLAFPIELLIV
jgi:hypothetical protein